MAKKPIKRRRKTPPASPPPPAAPPVPVAPEDVPLSDTERRFVDEWLVDRSATKAYLRVSPGVSRRHARNYGAEIRNRPHVAAEIAEGLRLQRVRSEVSADKIVEELARIAFSDILELYDYQTDTLLHPRHIPYNIRRCIASIKVTRQRVSRTRNKKTVTTVTDSTVEYRLWNKGDALGKLMKHLGMHNEIPPLEALLALLPRDMSAGIRKYLARDAGIAGPPPAPPPPPLTGSAT